MQRLKGPVRNADKIEKLVIKLYKEQAPISFKEYERFMRYLGKPVDDKIARHLILAHMLGSEP